MSYPGYPPNNQGYPGQSGMPGQTGMPGMPGQTGMPGMPGQTGMPGMPGQSGMPGMPGSQPSYPQYPAGNIGQQGYPMPNAYPTGQPSYPQQSSYPQVGQYPPQQPGQYPPQQPGQYPPQQPGQYPPRQPPQGQFSPNSDSYIPNSSMYPTSSMAGQYPPSSYQSQSSLLTQPEPIYPIGAGYPYTQQGGGYGGGSQIPTQASYPPVSSPAHYLPGKSGPAQKKFNPTLRPANPFDPHYDAEVLRKAMKGIGTDEKAIIHIVAHRVNSQRQLIAIQFKTMYGKDLIDNLKSELGGKLEDLIVALMTPTYDFLASELHYAVDGIGTCEETIIEIICSASNAEINNIKMAYHRLFGNDLEKDLKGETSGTFRRLLVSLCQGRRSENTNVDVASAQTDAQNLLQAGQLQFGTDESTFNMILCSRSCSQLEQVFLEYHRLTGRDFEDTIKSEFSGDIEKGLRAIVKSVRNKSAYFAKRLHECMDGFGTHDRALIRIIATRCEIDMVDIKNAYMSMYGKSLETDIASDTSGDYRKCLTALVVG